MHILLILENVLFYCSKWGKYNALYAPVFNLVYKETYFVFRSSTFTPIDEYNVLQGKMRGSELSSFNQLNDVLD